MNYSDLSNYVRPECQGAPEFLIERAVRDSVIDFCIRTDVYIADPLNLAIVADTNSYSLTIPSQAELNRVIDVYDNQFALRPMSYTALLKVLGNEVERASPKYYAQRDNTVLYFAPIPNAARTLRVLYSLKPSSDSTSIPDTIGLEYRETIVHGAIYRLQMMNGQPFTNGQAAMMNKQLFDRQVGRVVRQIQYGFVGGALTVRSREFI
jgi:hypothetical protein